jgi:hypothetical protein
MKYFGQFTSYKPMITSWGNIDSKELIPSPQEVLFASYGTENYAGDAIVVFIHDGCLYEVNGSHCSCYGLSESNYDESGSQWKAEKTTKKALAMRRLDEDQHSSDARKAFYALANS